MAYERTRAVLQKEDQYLNEAQKALEFQLTLLQAEKVVLERLINHRQQATQEQQSAHFPSSSNLITNALTLQGTSEEISSPEHLPALQLDIMPREEKQFCEEFEEDENDSEA